MKKTLLLLASAAMLLVGCAKEKLGPDAGSGEMVTANFTAQMQGMPQTKSVTDGDGTKANRCVMEIYYKGVLYTRDVQSIEGMKATFTPRLVSNRTYDVLFWADCGEGLADKYYTTDAEGLGLQAVEMKATAYAANDDARDAFYTTESVPVGQQVSSEAFTLTRPFAQVNIITTDAAIIKNANLYPDGVKMVYTAPTKFNLLTETLSEEKELTVTGAPYEAFDATSPALTLEMDYLFTGEDKSALDIAFEASKTGEATVTSHSFTNIPVQRNYRTNIKGALLTTTGDWTATIVPGWNQPDEEVNFVEAGSVAAANEAFANGATSVKITSVGEETNLYLPQTTEEVTIDFANPDKGVTVKYGPAPVALTKAAVAGDKPDVVNIATNDVTKFVVTGISNVVWLAGNQAALANALCNATAAQTVALSNDITMSGEWTPVPSYSGTFDGKNHVINNLKVSDYTGNYVGFFSVVSGATIKNVTFKNATLTNAESLGGNARGAVIAGWSYACNIDNCHVINSSVTGCQKVGGILGSMSVEGAAGLNSVTNCSVDGLTISCNIENDLFQSGALIGYIQFINANPDGILIENNSVKDITFNDDSSDYGNVGYYNGTFIGTISRKQQVDGQKIVLNNNTISGTNTELFKTIYSSPYFGWATNAENYTGAIAPILIDGVEWTPNYPVKNETKGIKYPTLAKAVTDASAGDRITLEDGVYELPSLSDITIEGLGDNVVVNHSSGSICATSNATIKKVVFNLGQNGYHGFQHASNLVLDGCTFNGFQTTYGSTTYKNCTFNQDTYAYNMNAYGCEIVCENCVFNGKGKAVYVYDEGNTDMYHISFNGCTFNEVVGDRTACKAAILVKENYNNQKYVVNINNCIANFDKYVPDDPDLTGSSLWNMELKDGVTGTDVTVNLNNEKVYPFTKFSVSDAAGLRNAIKMFNKGKEQVEYSIELADGTYEVSDMPIIQAAKKSLVVNAKNEGKAILTPDAGTKTNMIFLISGGGLSTTGDEWVTFEGLKFNMPSDPGKITSAVFCTTQNDATYSPLVGESMTRYAHNITVRNCELQGCGSENSSLLKAAQGAGANIAVVDNCVVNHSGYVVSDYFSNVNIVNTKVTDTKACANIANVGITVEGCDISTYHDYCIRTNGGAVVVKDNTFTMTYDGTSTTAGIVVLRGTGNQASISGNNITKAVNTMWDCYCATAWTVNGEAKAAGTGINF